MSWGGGKEPSKERVEKIAGGDVRAESKALDKELQKLIEKEQQFERRAKEEGQHLDAESLAKFSKHLPRLIQRTLSKIEASRVYQTFKLPGTDYVVHDRRDAKKEGAEQKDQGEEIAEEAKKPLSEMLVKEGKLFRKGGKGYENYLADPGQKASAPELKAAEQRLQKLLSQFEKLLLKRFEKGEEFFQTVEKGKFTFFQKTAKQWRAFFSRFLQRTVKRRVPMQQLQESVFRGFVQKQAKGTMISDLMLRSGAMEKFARMKVVQENQQLMRFLSQLKPGTRISAEDLKKFLTGDLEYLAIKQGEKESGWAKAPQKGKFFESAQTEARVAGNLGLQLGEQLKEKGKVLRDLQGRRKGVGGFGPGEEGSGGNEPREQFIPWWQYGLQGKSWRFGFAALLFVILLGILLGLSTLF